MASACCLRPDTVQLGPASALATSSSANLACKAPPNWHPVPAIPPAYAAKLCGRSPSGATTVARSACKAVAHHWRRRPRCHQSCRRNRGEVACRTSALRASAGLAAAGARYGNTGGNRLVAAQQACHSINRPDPPVHSCRMTTAQPRLCLNMIVRNEAAIIERCLASVVPYIDSWVIVDTGSATSQHHSSSRSCARPAPGELHHEPFSDFSTSRNHALDLCRARRVRL